ncbi:NAD-dependent epimerase/dehydratase family protein [Streptomyces sp. NBC_00237]|uniref:NAD-dependent epimerase/dehydratase family protein n=1 Tax=Streptomyces sp. NBC_00237 TaxID=2975687 RepID=UPI0022529059|nr:NAD-dependent epimerase/dehydratase family protein [Streptomyces sp. NBC_00237]MCX5206874.1 NAD-dependent epimerase/dehydratase family protein [Streptomyces sp. NBC_00237]
MIVTITGGAGFIGSNLARTLTQHPKFTEVRVLDNFSTGYRENLADLTTIALIEGDILNPADLDTAFQDVDAIVHLAALPSVPRSVKNPLATHHANATGTLQVLEAARRTGNPHVIAASSSSVYGATPTLPKHEALPTAPMSPYAVSKLATEAYLTAYHHSYDLPVLPFRFFNVYGPRQRADHPYAAVIPKWLTAARSGRPLPLHGDGTQSRDFTYIDTVSDTIADALLRKVVSSTPVNLAFGARTSLLELARTIEERVGNALPIEASGPRPGDVSASQADPTRLRTLFPRVNPTSLGAGLSATFQWLSSAGLR